MGENLNSLERKLNKIIDNELKKDLPEIDDRLVMECCDSLLRMDNTDRYLISKSEIKSSIETITDKKLNRVVRIKKSVKILLIAAIIAVLLAIGSLGYAQYKYNIFNFSDHSIVVFNSDKRRVGELTVGYVPEGFALNYESNNKYEDSKEYVCQDNFFTISKHAGTDKISINTEYKDSKVTRINEIDYIEYGEVEHGQGIVWEHGGYQYVVTGNISKQDLFKIAISVDNN